MTVDVKKSWNACGEAFDRFTTAEDSFSENIERPAIASLVRGLTGAAVLDLGCGSGTYSTWLAERGAKVTGLDLSHTMVALARGRAAKRGVDANFQVADIREPLPFNDAEFDLVFTATALHYVENLSATLKEVKRVMKPEARFVASVLHPMSTARFALPGSAEMDGMNPWEGWYFGSPERCIETPWLGFGEVSSEGRQITCHHHTISDYFKAIASAGLAITELLEPAPSAEFADKNIERYDEAMRSPVYLIFRAHGAK